MATYNSGYVEVDGRTGDPIGGIPVRTEQYSSSYQNGTGAQYGGQTTYTTSSYQPASYTETRAYGGGYTTGGHVERSGYVSGGHVERSGYVGGGYAERSGYVQGGREAQIVNTVVNTATEVIKGESRIEYVPFEKKITEYIDQPRVERVPRTRTITEYREEVRVEEVPREVTITDYYAVEYLRQYIPQYIP